MISLPTVKFKIFLFPKIYKIFIKNIVQGLYYNNFVFLFNYYLDLVSGYSFRPVLKVLRYVYYGFHSKNKVPQGTFDIIFFSKIIFPSSIFDWWWVKQFYLFDGPYYFYKKKKINRDWTIDIYFYLSEPLL